MKLNKYLDGFRLDIPIYRYVLGASFILLVSSLLNYSLSYLTPVLALGYLAPGVKPLSLKQATSFLMVLLLANVIAIVFSSIFLNYTLVFIPLFALGVLWLYFSDKLPMMVKVFALISFLLIPMLSIQSGKIGAFVAVSLINNALMAVVLTQIVFLIFPWGQTDEVFFKSNPVAPVKTENQRFKYAVNILAIVFPVVLLFYFFGLYDSLVVLIFISILSMSPALANAKVGLVMIVANIIGGLMAILVYHLLTVVPMLLTLILLTLLVGLVFASKLFSKHKFAPVFGTAFSTFLLILGSVTSSDAEAGSKVWTRIIQIGIAVIYVVIVFRVMEYFNNSRKSRSL
ncbi:hypothetical protein [Cognatitamlana onchidii]|uniref:hypothetical protein n=1 Tax=Cognatitamlana onchidii TaxID=2562860 RepID=UPI001455EA74|nr:hypothetical protein [Algibacter onchidii]